MKRALLFTFLLALMGFFAGAKQPTPLSERLGSRWQRQALFFGVNEAWKLKASPKIQATYLARDQYRPFELENFPFADYPKYLTELRSTGLRVAGITDWKILEYTYERTAHRGILVKIKGTYQRKSESVLFSEWQLFEKERYSQAAIITPSSAAQVEVNRAKVLTQVLKL